MGRRSFSDLQFFLSSGSDGEFVASFAHVASQIAFRGLRRASPCAEILRRPLWDCRTHNFLLFLLSEHFTVRAGLGRLCITVQTSLAVLYTVLFHPCSS